ncbi:hypothetical protein V8G54_010226, partial [Vigna mungo]
MMMKPMIRYEVSDLVGDSTQAKKSFGRGASKRACNIGRAKAPVFPEPVWASPITSLPSNARGIASVCIFSGVFQPNFSQASTSDSDKPKSLNVFISSFSSAIGSFSP